jgi:teichuronic acid biosynthesis glycosyltransferase TuaH
VKAVFVSHTADGGAFKIGSHHLAREFARRGWQVAHVSTPFSPIHIVRGRRDQHRMELAVHGPQVDDVGVLHAVPRVLAPMRISQSRKILTRYLQHIGFADADYLILDQPLMAAMIDASTRSKIIYRATDLYTQGIARRRQTGVLERAQALVATSSLVMDDLRQQRPELPHLVLENGVEWAAFAGAAQAHRVGAVYVGAIDHRFDWAAVAAVATILDPQPVIIAGPVRTDVPDLPLNVEIVGPVRYADVPTLLGGSTIGLLPFNEALVNEGRSPMKYFEYLAAGLFIVGRVTTELRRRDAPGVYLYEGHTSIVAAVRAAMVSSKPNIAGARVAAGHDWVKKAERLERFVLGV